MGPPGFFPWITKKHGYVPKKEYISAKAKLILDVKGLMYTMAWGVPSHLESGTTEFQQAIATAILAKVQHFASVVMVNDGRITKDHPKFATTCKRREELQKRQDVHKKRKIAHDQAQVEDFFKRTDGEGAKRPEIKTADEIDAEETKRREDEATLERSARSSRPVSRADSIEICKMIYDQQPSTRISYIQIGEGEADQILMSMAREEEEKGTQLYYVVSNDADMLVGGVRKLLNQFCTPNQAVFDSVDICTSLGISLLQLQQIVAISGSDYDKKGIGGMGLITAYKYIVKYGNLETMLAKWPLDERAKYDVPSNIEDIVATAVSMYQNQEEEL